MKIKKTRFKVQVLNSEKLPISNAEVVLTSRKKEYVLNCENKKGYYASEKKSPKGEYLLTISKNPFAAENRKVRIDGSDQLELFILLKKGMPFYFLLVSGKSGVSSVIVAGKPWREGGHNRSHCR